MRTWPLSVLALVMASCSGPDRPSTGDAVVATTTTPAGPAEGVGPELAAFLERAAGAGEVAFLGEYEVFRKLGPVETTVVVEAAPPAVRITAGDVVVVDGPTPATCSVAEERCEGTVREERLVAVGVFTPFFTSGPVQALESLARRVDDQPPVFTNRDVAGMRLDCVSIPVQRSVTNTSCITADGVFGYVDNPSVRYELTRYEAGPPAGPVEPPFPISP